MSLRLPRRSSTGRKDATRHALLEAALNVFGEKGYHGAAVDDIVDRAGRSKGAAYFHFPSKAAIFRALVRELANQLVNSIQRKMDDQQTAAVLRDAIPLLERLECFAPEAQQAAMASYAKASGFKNGQVFGTLRAAVTGQRVSPPTFETMEILGKAESLRRLKLALESLAQPVGRTAGSGAARA